MKLTPLSKVFIGLVALCVLGYVLKFKYRHSLTSLVALTAQHAAPSTHNGGPGTADLGVKHPRRIVIGVNDFGGGYPLLLANDGAQPGAGSLFKKAGLDVEVRLIRGHKERLRAFAEGDLQVMLLTVDHLANLFPAFQEKGVELRSFLLVDWSRGNLGIVAKPTYPSIESLKSARIATTRNTPTHYFLLSLLARSSLTADEIEAVKKNLVFAPKLPQVVELFRQGEVDAMVAWEPFLSEAAAAGKGVPLVTTATATNQVASVLLARKDWLAAHPVELLALSRAYFDAVDELGRGAEHAIELAATTFMHKPAQIAATLNKIKPATFADNREFFGLGTKGGAYDTLYREASELWQKEGLIKQGTEPAQTTWLAALESLAPQYREQKVGENFHFSAAPDDAAPALLTKRASINFANGQSTVDANVGRALDAVAETLTIFQNAYVRIESNTDNVGNPARNTALSKARAAAMIDYLSEHHHLDRARFTAIGNGAGQPIADNRTPEGRELNRRTEFKLSVNRDGNAGTPSVAGPDSLRKN